MHKFMDMMSSDVEGLDMNYILKNKVLHEDLINIINSNVPLKKLFNSNILITGATGLIGSLLIKMFVYCNQFKNGNIKIIAVCRNVEKARNVLDDIIEREDVELIIGDINNPIEVRNNVDYIIHGANITNSRLMIEKPVETILTAINGTKNILNLAKEKNTKSVVYLSSMEVYGSFGKKSVIVNENKLGYIDPIKIRSNYPESKRMCENLCVAYNSEYDVPVKIARLAQTFGAGILPGENRVFAQFARSAIKNENIVLHTKGKSEGNYCYTSDVICALIILLISGKNGEAYNISNEKNHISIGNMAKMVAKKFGNGQIKVVFDIPKSNVYGYATDTKIKLSTKKIQNLGWNPKIDLEEMYRRLISSMERNK